MASLNLMLKLAVESLVLQVAPQTPKVYLGKGSMLRDAVHAPWWVEL
jgi:hypothetical protein